VLSKLKFWSKNAGGIGKKTKILPNVRMAAEVAVEKIPKIVNPLATASAFAGNISI